MPAPETVPRPKAERKRVYLRVVEVNNLLTSSFYECDIERIVDIIVNQLEQIG